MNQFWQLFWQRKKSELVDVCNCVSVKSLVWVGLILVVCLAVAVLAPMWLHLRFLWFAIAIFVGCLIYIIVSNAMDIKREMKGKVK